MKSLFAKAFLFLKNIYVEYYTFRVLNKIWKEQTKGIQLKELTSEQRQAIQAYWKPLVGKKVTTKWHQLIYSISGCFNPKYEPFDIAMKVQRNLSPGFAQKAFDNKGLYHQLLTGFNTPTRVGLCSNGVYYLPSLNSFVEVSFKEFLQGISDITDCIIKPCIGTDGGRGVSSIEVLKGIEASTGLSIHDFITQFQKKYGFNYCIEQKVHECDNLQCLNPSSCNTLRIHTYRNRIGQKIQVLSSYIRIGKSGEIVDNTYSGGFCGRISKDGYLDRLTRVYPYFKGNKTESGIDISHYKIDNFDKIIQTVKKAHSQLPMFDLIGWDVTIDRGGVIIIIEFNPNPDMRIEQCVFDHSCLGDLQEEIINRVYK